MINSNITTDCLVVIILVVTLFLAYKNNVIKHDRNRHYFIGVVLTLILLVLEIATEILMMYSEPKLVLLHNIVNVFGFILTPVVPISMTYLYDNKKLCPFRWILLIPIILNTILVISSPWTGWIFKIGENNTYSRGPYFFVLTIISLVYFLVLISIEIRNYIGCDEEEHVLLFIIIILPVIGIILQILFPRILLIWGCVSVSLVLYYILISQRQYKYDVLTGIPNRVCFQKEMQQLFRTKGVLVAVFDLNNLKKTNDKWGHAVGDEMIKAAATIIHRSFKDYGTTYRIGGDEFCVICRNISEDEWKQCIESLNQTAADFRMDNINKLVIACGYSYFDDSGEMFSIYDAFIKADHNMYDNKRKLKSIDSESTKGNTI